MADRNVEQVLLDMKARFGLDVFKQKQKFLSVFGDLAPDCKKEKQILGTAIEMGVPELFARAAQQDADIVRCQVNHKLEDMMRDEAIALVFQSFAVVYWGEDVKATAPEQKAEPRTVPVEPPKAKQIDLMNLALDASSHPSHYTTNPEADFLEALFHQLCHVDVTFEEVDPERLAKLASKTVPMVQTPIQQPKPVVKPAQPTPVSSDFEIRDGVLVKYHGNGGDVVVPEGVTSIGESAFLFCKSLTSIHIPDSVTSIGERAFEYCTSLTSVHIPESVKLIKEGAFKNCTALHLTLPKHLKPEGIPATRCFGCRAVTYY